MVYCLKQSPIGVLKKKGCEKYAANLQEKNHAKVSTDPCDFNKVAL